MNAGRVSSVRVTLLALALVLASFASPPGRTAALAATASPPRAIALTVDASEVTKKIVHTHEVIPAQPGPFTLYYPKWIPGEHGPTGPLTGMAGLKLIAAGRRLEWQRDLEDMYAIHCVVPAGAIEVSVDFDLQTAQENAGFTSGASATATLAVLNWNQHVVYPAGTPADDLTFAVSLRIPAGWHAATALRASRDAGATLEFRPVSLVTLVDSPVQMGAYTKTIVLNPGDARPVTLHLAADSRAALELAPGEEDHYRALVAEARALFGARHYDQYHFLFTLSDHIAAFGLEHHESSDDRDQERALVDPDLRLAVSDLLSHEYMHSWNGKYRRPADLTTPDFQQPMLDDLLWVYEGLTQYLGCLMAARSGIETAEQYRENLAIKAAYLDAARGREWRPLVDTAVEAQLLYDAPREGAGWRRGVAFYDEGLLMWLEADAILREKSGGKHSLDDFCRRFHGGEDTSPRVVTYTREDVIATLQGLAPYDWKTFFMDRVDHIAPHPPTAGLEAEGWRLAWRDSSSEFYRALEASNKEIDLEYSIGLLLNVKEGDDNGKIKDIMPGSAADRAGVAPGMKLVAVNGREWSEDLLHDAIRATASGAPLELLIENTKFFKTCRLEYRGGERYPWLERIPGKPDVLSELIAPQAAGLK